MTKLLYAWKASNSGSEIRHRVVTDASDMLTLEDNGRIIYIDTNDTCTMTLPLTSEVPYGYTVTVVYINNSPGSNSIRITMQGDDVSGGYILRGRIQPLDSVTYVKGFIYNNNTRSGDTISITLLGEGRGIYTGYVSEASAIDFDYD